MKEDDVAFNNIIHNVKKIKERIHKIATQAGRNADDITIIAATKTRSPAEINSVIKAGITTIGENRVFEAKEKILLVEEDADWHLIGILQSNKIKDAVKIFSTIHSVYKKKTAELINKYAEMEDKIINVLIEVNTSKEETKGGVLSEKELFSLIESIMALKYIKIIGLMTIGPNTTDSQLIRQAFKSLHIMLDNAKKTFSDLPLKHLSMGMSNDYHIAIEEGATMVRIGTAIFGPRKV